MQIIAVGHKKQSGKDTFGKFLITHLEGKSYTTAFAFGLKQEVSIACGLNIKELEDNKHIFRPMLQWWGTEFRRKFQKNDSYWINEVEKLYQAVKELKKYRYFIITDCRFRNEANYVKSKGGILIKVVRDTGELDCHGSECDLDHYDGWDHTINNNKDLENLEVQAKWLAQRLNSKEQSHS